MILSRDEEPGRRRDKVIPTYSVSSSVRLPVSRRAAFTLIEMLITIALLIIVLGLMVSLARHVRDRSAQQLTLSLLRDLDGLMSQYVLNSGGSMPPLAAILPADATVAKDGPELAAAALMNNRQWVTCLRQDYRLRQIDPNAPPDPFDAQPISVYDRRSSTLRDAWGSPIVFMAGQHPLVGLAPSERGRDRSFFFSAGQDRKYLTREDNLYSYEALETAPRP